jgi:hypothetical protein
MGAVMPFGRRVPVKVVVSSSREEPRHGTFTARSPSTQAGHLRRQSRLIDEDELGWTKIERTIEPRLTPLQEAAALLFHCVRGLFERPTAAAEPGAQGAAADPNIRLRVETAHHLVERAVLLLLDHSDDEGLGASCTIRRAVLTPRRGFGRCRRCA